MSFVGEPFVHDLFVSYSHGDFAGDDESPLKAWSQGFAKELERELRTQPKFARSLSIFLDQDQRPSRGIDPLAPLTEQLKEEIGKSGLLTVLLSPHYLASDWCRDEREWWEAAQEKWGLKLTERIALTRILPLPGAPQCPRSFLDSRGELLTGFWFYDRGELDARPYDWPRPTGDSKDPFRKAVVQLAGMLGRQLEKLKTELEERRRAQREVERLAGEGQVIFLHGRIEQASAWERAGEELSSNGFTVVPAEPEFAERDPNKLQKARYDRVRALTGCDALLLLGSEDGPAMDADMVVVGRHDRQSARAITNRLLPCALLDTVGGSIANPRRKSIARGLQVDWLDSTKPPWVSELRHWLSEKSAAAGD